MVCRGIVMKNDCKQIVIVRVIFKNLWWGYGFNEKDENESVHVFMG